MDVFLCRDLPTAVVLWSLVLEVSSSTCTVENPANLHARCVMRCTSIFGDWPSIATPAGSRSLWARSYARARPTRSSWRCHGADFLVFHSRSLIAPSGGLYWTASWL